LPAERLILASRSPQRRAILERLGVEFEVVVPEGVSELAEGPAVDVAVENARRKAVAVGRRAGSALVLGADTVVALGDRLLPKPVDEARAREWLEALSGRAHTVAGGLCLAAANGSTKTGHAVTRVRFRSLTPALVDWYLESGEWRERAGGYAIQGRGAALVEAIEGDYLNVVGLPVAALLDLVPELLG
jgi:septum formation protein